MRHVLRLLLASALLSLLIPQVQTDKGLLQAASTCYCSVTAYGHTYSGTFVGSQSGSMTQSANNNVQCAATICQQYAWTIGNNVCNTYGLNGSGTGHDGYVILNWIWTFQTWSGHPIQQYDCDDI